MPNRLIFEASPYLLQHAHNPVDWYPWGEEALQKAQTENRPIFLSIGYAACHWCHVMERESFEDPAIAEFLNRNFVSIKVDREERPDLDQIYMQAVMAMRGGHGGWPLSAFLTPGGHAFFGGTYWPPSERQGMPGFDHVLQRVLHAFHHQSEQIERQSQEVTRWLQEQTRPGPAPSALPEGLLARSVERLHGSYDFEWGGFGTAPKFPHSMHLDFLLRAGCSRDLPGGMKAEVPFEMVRLNLDSLACGGIFDQLGGGFARYSVDERWRVPHFEKMLCDNALLVPLYCNFHRLTGQERFARVARDVSDYLLRDLRDSAGGFHSSEDADSEGEEGKFYLWSQAEIVQTLGAEASDFCRAYGITPQGNFEGRNILHRPRIPESLNDESPFDEDRWATARRKLLDRRAARIRPGKDDKVLTNWNALAISAMASAAVSLGDPRYTAAANQAWQFVQNEMRDTNGRLLHTYRQGQAKQPGFLDDYALLVHAGLDLYEVEFDESLVSQALILAEEMIDLFADSDSGLFYYTGRDQPQLIVRNKELHDSSMPGGNSAAACSLIRLGVWLDRADLILAGQRVLLAAAELMERAPLALGQMLVATWLEQHLREARVLLAARPEDLMAASTQLQKAWHPHSFLLARLDKPQSAPRPLDHWFHGRRALEGQPTLYVCHGSTCAPPLVGLEAISRGCANSP